MTSDSLLASKSVLPALAAARVEGNPIASRWKTVVLGVEAVLDGARFDELFLRFMIQHHDGAVQMVDRLFATDGAAQDELVFKFANDVQVDQRTEIDRMTRLLADVLFNAPG